VYRFCYHFRVGAPSFLGEKRKNVTKMLPKCYHFSKYFLSVLFTMKNLKGRKKNLKIFRSRREAGISHPRHPLGISATLQPSALLNRLWIADGPGRLVLVSLAFVCIIFKERIL
jgi:hypothetical protein